MKQLRFGLFENPQTNDSGTSLWRYPGNKRDQFDTIEYWQEIAALCEAAHFDFLFLADAWGWADVNGTRPDVASTEGLDLPRLEPAIVAAALITSTKNLGLVMTGSTLLEAPYRFARQMASLDQLSGGRIGWNIVTTGSAASAVKAFGIPMVNHDDRYKMADDFMEVVYRLWEAAWEPDALEKNKDGRFADPAKVHEVKYEGPYFKTEGYGNTAYSPQGTPVLFQAGMSPAGRAFGGKHGEAIFLGGGTVEKLAETTKAIREEAVSNGRDPHSVKVMSAFGCVVAPTREEAEKKYEEILAAQNPEVAVASYAWFTGIDLSSYDPETPMSELSTELSQSQVSRFGDKTVGDVLKDWHTHGVGVRPYVGSAEEIADLLCDMAEGADLDGFLLQPQVEPGSLKDFVELVLPILQERGAAPTEYSAPTLRERLLGKDKVLADDHPGAALRHH